MERSYRPGSPAQVEGPDTHASEMPGPKKEEMSIHSAGGAGSLNDSFGFS